MAFKRGFKSWCETFASKVRGDLKLVSIAPLGVELLSGELDVLLLNPEQVPGIPETSRSVLVKQAESWSAITVSCGGQTAIVYNPDHSSGRNSSDVMHELAHVILNHRPATVILSTDTSLALRTFDADQEEEANWLAGCLLLPRPALLHIMRLRLSQDAACQEYRVSRELLTYRMNITGVSVQMKRARTARAL